VIRDFDSSDKAELFTQADSRVWRVVIAEKSAGTIFYVRTKCFIQRVFSATYVCASIQSVRAVRENESRASRDSGKCSGEFSQKFVTGKDGLRLSSS
jgi:hypothetical protein